MKLKKKKKKKSEHDSYLPDSEAVLNASVERPIAPRKNCRYRTSGFGYELYKKTDWDEWWDEFAEAIDKDGRPKYKTVWMFIKHQTHNKVERKLYYQMIGPKPELIEGKHLSAPWLGNWQLRRNKSFWSVENPGTMKQIQNSIKKQTDALNAARSVTPVVAQQIGRFTRLLERIDRAFGGEVFLPHLSPDHPKNKNRFKAYMGMINAASKSQNQVINLWFKAHGLDPSQPEAWLQMALLATGKIATGAALAGHRAGAMNALGSLLQDTSNDNGNSVTETDMLIAQHMRRKAATYNLPLPHEVKTIDADSEEESDGKHRTH